LLVLLGSGLLEIQRHDRGPRMVRSDDGVVDGFELANVATMQQHRRAMGSSCLGYGLTDAVARSGDENDSAGQRVGRGFVGAGIHAVIVRGQSGSRPDSQCSTLRTNCAFCAASGSFMPMRPMTW